MKKFKVYCPSYWDHHRSGWNYCVSTMRDSLHRDDGVALFSNSVETGLIESSYICDEPWVGFLHLSPSCFQSDYIQSKLNTNSCWHESLKNCFGIYVLSNSLKVAVESHLPVEVNSLFHPTEIPDIVFDWESFDKGPRRLMFVGHWLRKPESLDKISAKGYFKTFMGCGKSWQFSSTVDQVSHLDNDVYDRWLTQNIVFVDFHDSSANNIVVECIVRGTPILVNRLPALEEYLGKKYPLFFRSLEEADNILQDKGRLREAHEYLNSLDKTKFTGEGFVESIRNSSIYRKLGWNDTSSDGRFATLMNISHL